LSIDESFTKLLQEWRAELDKRIAKLGKNRKPSTLYEPIDYVLTGSGKRIRPILLLLACRAVGGKISQAWDAAVAVELLHNFTLVHDDIMDEDDTRRGRATVHKRWDTSTAILAGDGIYALAYEILLKTDSPAIAEALKIFTSGILEVCEGQAKDLEFEERSDVKLPEYIDMIGKKTAALLKASVQMGALIGGGSAEEVKALGAYAKNMGLAFQIQDDLLDIASDERTLGKSHASDLRQKKRTFLLLHALANGNNEQQLNLKMMLNGNIETPQVTEIKQLLSDIGSLEAARGAVKKYTNAARQQLKKISREEEKALLLSLLNFLADRNA